MGSIQTQQQELIYVLTLSNTLILEVWLIIFKGRLIYAITNKGSQMYVNYNASPSIALNSSTVTSNGITCGSISCIGSLVKGYYTDSGGCVFGYG